MKRRWHVMGSLDAIPRPRLWGGWSTTTEGYVTAELCDRHSGNAVLSVTMDVTDPPRWLERLIDRLNP